MSVYHNHFSHPLSAMSFIRARERWECDARAVVERRIEWGRQYAALIKKYGRRVVERMSGDKLNAFLDGREGVCVKHYSERVHGEIHGRRWTTQRIERVRVRTCKGKRT